MTYQVKIEAFEGPFDLLLHLISKRKVDVYEVDLAEITGDFLESLKGIDELDLETATRFLVVAATLIELKAARLLPTEDREELEDLLGDARDLLYARLLEYRAFREVANLLRARLEVHGGHYPRDVPLEPRFQRLVPEAPLAVTPWQLGAMATLATTSDAPERVDLSHIRRSYISIRQAAELVLGRLPGTGEWEAFDALVGERDRSDRVVLFLALLELYKLGHLELTQQDYHSSLRIQRREGGQDLATLSNDDLAADEGEPPPEDPDTHELPSTDGTPET